MIPAHMPPPATKCAAHEVHRVASSGQFTGRSERSLMQAASCSFEDEAAHGQPSPIHLFMMHLWGGAMVPATHAQRPLVKVCERNEMAGLLSESGRQSSAFLRRFTRAGQR
mmetsp:Transcript_22151/g.33179  ORF Transcript_22151/g.33179 Transcript_22151/m.33179 type:complete len:111 (+) Transcript_22151:49-381(+)